MPKKDLNQLAKSIVDIATGETPSTEETIFTVSGRKGGLKGGKARAESLTDAQRSEIAKKAARARWKL